MTIGVDPALPPHHDSVWTEVGRHLNFAQAEGLLLLVSQGGCPSVIWSSW